MAFVVTAVAAAVELGTFAAIATAVSEVGIAMSVVGGITGNKELSKWGGYLGIAGGVGGLAAGAFSTAAVSAGDGLAAGETGAMDMGVGGSGVLDSTAGSAGTAGEGLAASNTGAMDMGTGGSGIINDATNVGATDAGSLNSLSAPPTAPGADPSVTAPTTPTAPGADPAQAQGATTADNSFSDSRFNAQNGIDQSYTGSGSAAPMKDLSSNGVLQWFKNLDPKLQSTILQTGAGAASGLFQGWSAEQKLALEREKFNLDKEKYSTAVTNASSVPTVKFAPVGIINNSQRTA